MVGGLGVSLSTGMCGCLDGPVWSSGGRREARIGQGDTAVCAGGVMRSREAPSGAPHLHPCSSRIRLPGKR